MKHKQAQFTAQVKALSPEDGAQPGEFEALVAVFDNVDNVGDRLKSEAFDSTLERWKSSGDPIPVILSHQWDDPFSIIGAADPNDLRAIPGKGLYAKGVIQNIDPKGEHYNAKAAQVYALMKQGLLREFSFGYTVPKGGETKAADGAYDLTEVNLLEFGPCLKGVNPATELLGVKSLKAQALRDNDVKVKTYVDVDMPGSYEELSDALEEALEARYPAPTGGYTYVTVVATYPDRVVYQVCTIDASGDCDDEMYQASYTGTEDAGITLGDAQAVDFVPQVEAAEKALRQASWFGRKADTGNGDADSVIKQIDDIVDGLLDAYDLPDPGESESEGGDVGSTENAATLPADVASAITRIDAMTDAYMQAHGIADVDAENEKADKPDLPDIDALANEVLTKAWNGAASNYTDEEYAKACILDRGDGFDTAKERYGLPIADPGKSYASDPDPDGVHAAASRIGQVQASAAAKKEAYRRLKAAYGHLNEEAPDSVVEGAKAVTPPAGPTPEELHQREVDTKSLDLELYNSAIDNFELGMSIRPFNAEAEEANALDDKLAAELARLTDLG